MRNLISNTESNSANVRADNSSSASTSDGSVQGSAAVIKGAPATGDTNTRPRVTVPKATHGVYRPLTITGLKNTNKGCGDQRNDRVEQTQAKFLHELFEASAARMPDNIAVDYEGGEQMTYAQLNARANQLAHLLRDTYNVGPEVMVPLCVDKSVDMVVAILAVLKAGGAYVPLDPKHPAERLQYIVGNVDATVVLAHAHHAHLFDGLSHVQVVNIDQCDTSKYSDSNPVVTDLQPFSLAYVIYTSGSTGQPKGVVIEHDAVVHAIRDLCPIFAMTPATRMLQFSSYTFDVSVSDIFMTLAAGATMCVPSPENLYGQIERAINVMKVNTAYFAASTAQLVRREQVPTLQVLGLGAEYVPQSLHETWAEHVKLINIYGPTETTIYCTWNPVPTPDVSSNIIGKVFGANRALVLDDNMHPLEQGMVGELCIGGPQLARGYLKDPVKTAAAFVPHPFVAGERLYRTGDLVRQLADGALEILGRKDTQVKLNGLRIDTGEVDAAVVGSGAVVQAHTRLVDEHGTKGSTDDKPKKHLAVFFVPAFVDDAGNKDARVVDDDGQIAAVQECVRTAMAHARAKLPEYMLPRRWVPITRMPLNTNGKTDSRALLSLLSAVDVGRLALFMGASDVKELPRTDNERLLHKLWCELFDLGGDKIGRDDSFFQLGGDSVSAIRLVDKCQAAGFTVTVPLVLAEPVLKDLAAKLTPLKQAMVDCDSTFDMLPSGTLVSPQMQSALQDMHVSAADVQDIFPASHLQRGMFARTLLTGTQYLSHLVFDVYGDFDAVRFRAAFNTVVAKNSVLRTRLVHLDSAGMCNVTLCDSELEWGTDACAETELELKLAAFLARDRERSFAYNEPLIRCFVLRAEQQQHVFVLTFHHALHDAWTLSLLYADLLTAYRGESLPERPPYSRYIRYLQTRDVTAANAFWAKQLEYAATTPYPAVKATQAPRQTALERLPMPWNTAAFTAETQIPSAVVFQACWAKLLSMYAGVDDVIFGCVISGRDVPVAGITETMGLCISTIPIRVRVNPDATILEMLRDVQQTIVESIAHAGSERTANSQNASCGHGGELFRTMCNFRGFSEYFQNDPSLPFKLAQRPHIMDNDIPLALEIDIIEGGVMLSAMYDSNVLQADEVRLLLQQMQHGMRYATQNPKEPWRAISFVSNSEVVQLQSGIDSGLPALVGEHQYLHELFEASAARMPDNIAVDYEGGEQMTYAQLNARANQLAHLLRDTYNVGPEVMVPLCVDKSVDMVVAILAVLKAGGAYVPLDPKHPADRLQYIVGNVDATVVLAHAQHAHLFDGATPSVHTVVLDDLDLSSHSIGSPIVQGLQPSNLAYVIYTSGSTGLPKGVLLEHGPAVLSVTSQVRLYRTSSTTRMLQFSNYAFDVSVGEVFMTLAAGGCLCIALRERLLNDVCSVINSMSVNCAALTPSVINLIDPLLVPGLQTLSTGGEEASQDLVKRWANRVRLLNVYGPTETLIACFGHEATDETTSPARIGRPFGMARGYVLDDQLQLVPAGAVGELCVSGPQLARGYLKDPAKTAAAFVPHPFVAGERLYRTGDLVRQLADGALEILGRKDTQVKLNGLRIDTGEVDAAVVGSGAVVQAYTVLVEDSGSGVEGKKKRLTTFVVPTFIDNSGGEEASVVDGDQQLALVQECVRTATAAARTKLPQYMVPTRWLPVTRMPLNSSGKTDRRALLRLLAGVDVGRLAVFMGASDVKEPPRTDNERLLHKLWCELFLLSGSEVGRDDSFFQLGGDSIKAIHFVQKLRALGYALLVTQVMQLHKLCDMAKALSATDVKHRSTAPDVLEPFSLLSLVLGESAVDFSGEERSQSVLSLFADDLARYGISPDDVEDLLPSSAIQEALVALTLQDNSQYLTQLSYDLKGVVDAERLMSAFNTVLHDTPILRTTFIYAGVKGRGPSSQRARSDMQLLQLIRKPDAGRVQWVNINPNIEQLDDAVQQYLDADRQRGVELGGQFMPIEKSQSTLVWTIHHALYDGWCLQRMFDDVLAVYDGQSVPQRLPYAHYIRYVGEQDHQAADHFWGSYLADAVPTVFDGQSLLPSSSPSLEEAKAVHTVERTVPFKAHTLMQSGGVTMATLLKAGWGWVLARFSNNDDVLFGSVSSGRDIDVANATDIMGPCINTLVARVRTDSKQVTVGEWLRAMHEESVQQLQHGYVGLQDVKRLVPSLAHSNLFYTLLNYTGTVIPESAYTTQSLTVTKTRGDMDLNYPIVVHAQVSDASLHVQLAHKSTVGVRDAERLLSSLCGAVQYLATHPDSRIDDIRVVSQVEEQLLQRGIVSGSEPVQSDLRFFHELFEASATRMPENIAVDFDGGEQMTYAQLNARANQLAHLLRDTYNVGPEVMVPLCVDKSVDMVVAILAVLKAGGAYVPLDPKHPADRLQYIVGNVDATVVLVHAQHAHLFDGATPSVHTVVLDDLDLSSHSTSNISVRDLQPSHLAYVIYTSGSTGQPKGVMIEHGAAVASMFAQDPVYGLRPHDRMLQFSNYTFDASVSDFFLPWLVGACVCLAPMHRMLENVSQTFVDLNITAAYMAATAASMLSLPDDSTLRLLAVGAELVPQHLIDRWAGKLKLLNIYGPTETTVTCIVHEVHQPGESSCNIGDPFGPNVLFVLDDNMRVVAPGMVGELCIGGPQLARGYLKDPAKTAAAFVPHPFVAGERLYRTGDLVRQLADGALEILGRKDTQVKLNGLRIDTGEVDAAVVGSGAVVQAYTVLVEDSGSGVEGKKKRLTTFVVPTFIDNSGGEEASVVDGDQQLALVQECVRTATAAARTKLPQYMVPTRWLPVTRMPLNSSGKTDRRALLRLLAGVDVGRLAVFMGASDVKEPPRTDNERLLHKLWCELFLLSGSEVGRDDSFFQLGGDSIYAIKMVQKLRLAGLSVASSTLYAHPQLCKLAAMVTAVQAQVDVPAPFSLLPSLSLTKAQVVEALAQYVDLGHTDIDDAYPLSALQEGMVALNRENTAMYNTPYVVDIRGDFDLEHFKHVWDSIAARNPVLRTTFVPVEANGQVTFVQVVRRHTGFTWHESQCTSEADLKAHLDKISDDLLATPFEWGKAFMRHHVVRVAPQHWKLVWSIHHALEDNWDITILETELHDAYSKTTLKPRPPYSIYIRHTLERNADESRAFWRDYLHEAMPTPYPQGRPQTEGQSSVLVREHIIPVACDASALLTTSGVTTATLFHGAWALVLALHTGIDDVLFGAVHSGRDIPVDGITEMMGMCLMTTPMRVRTQAQQTVADFLQRLQGDFVALASHGYLGMRTIQKEMRHTGLTRQLFQTMVNYRGARDTLVRTVDSRMPFALRFEGGRETTEWPISISGDIVDGTLYLQMEWDGAVVSESQATLLQRQMGNALQWMASHPHSLLGQCEYMDAVEQEDARNGITSGLQTIQSNHHHLHRLFEANVARAPDAVAVDYQGGEQMTYAQLNARANQLAHLLRDTYNVGPEVMVPLCVDKSVDMVVAILAVLKAGGAYVPLDPKHPAERLQYIVGNVDATVVLAHAHHAHLFDGLSHVQVVNIDQCDTSKYSDSNPVVTDLQPSSLAYVIYTSGSTGQPKGVMVEHQAAVAAVAAHCRTADLTETARVLQYASYVFDVSVSDIFGCLNAGARLCLVSAPALQNDLALWLQRLQVDVADLPPSVLMFLDPKHHQALTTLIVGGERVFQRWSAGRRLINMYGPTETTISSVEQTYDNQAGAANVVATGSVIGKPMGENICFVLGENMQLVAQGMVGELCIGGPQLARGYLKDPVKTAAAFVSHPFVAGERLYRTGDLVRQLADGALEILGRRDTQVKLNGLRIDTGEVDAAVVGSGAAVHAHTLLTEDKVDEHGEPSKKQLTVFFVPALVGHSTNDKMRVVGNDEQMPPVQECVRAAMAHARGKLPQYMVPTRWVPVTRMPVNSSGKADTRALIALYREMDHGLLSAFMGASDVKQAPQTDVERVLHGVWCELFGLRSDQVGRDDSFFQLGGDSITAIKLVQKLRRTGVNAPIDIVLRYPTLAECAQHITPVAIPPVAGVIHPTIRSHGLTVLQRLWLHLRAVLYALLLIPQKLILNSPSQSPSPSDEPSCLVDIHIQSPAHPTVFLVHAVQGMAATFTSLRGRQLNCNVCAIGSPSASDLNASRHTSLAAMARAYYRQIVERQPTGPYLVGGYSMGGQVAIEIARLLQDERRARVGLILLDSHRGVCAASPFTLFPPTLSEPELASLVQSVVPASNYGDEQFVHCITEEIRHNYNLLSRYYPRSLDSRAVLLRASIIKPSSDLQDDGCNGWSNTLPHLATIDVPGDHFNILAAQNVDGLVKQLTRAVHHCLE
ncbi:hypothetical protein RI367_005436 [Sorochytrium milnesiophthora]